MIAWGAVRTAVTWLVAGYLVAVATVLVPALALTRLIGSDPAERWAGIAALVAAGPVAGVVAAAGTLAGAVGGAVFAGARPAPPDVVTAVAQACRARHVRPPVCWTAPDLDPSAPPVVLRGLRAGYAFLPADVTGRPVDDVGDAVARSVAGGGASTLLAVLAVCRWSRVWVEAARLCGAPVDTLRRGRASAGATGPAAALQVVLLPFLLLAVVCAVPAWVAARVACLLVAPARLEAAAQVFGTTGGRSRVVQEVADPEAFADVTPWALQRSLGHTRARALAPVEGDEPSPVDRWWRRPVALGAVFTLQPLAFLAMALVFLAPALGFVGEALTERSTLPGEHRVAAVVTAVRNDPDDAVLTDVSENSHITVAVTGTGDAASFDTSQSTWSVGDAVSLAASTSPYGGVDLRWPERRSVQRLVTMAVLPVLLAWAVFLVLARVNRGRVADDVRSARAAQDELVASAGGTDPVAAAAVRARWERRAAAAAHRRVLVGWSVVAVLPALFVGWLGSFPGRGVGALVGHTDAGRQLGFLVTAAAAWLAGVWLGRVAVRRRPPAAATAGRHGG